MDQILTQLFGYFCVFGEAFLFFEKPLLSAGRTRFSNAKNKQKLDQLLTQKRANIGPNFNYTSIYIYMPDGCWGDRVSSKNGPVRGPPKSRFGDHAFSHYKNWYFRGKVRSQQERPEITNCTPHGPRGLFCRNTHLNLCTGQLGTKPLRQGCCPYKNRVG